MSYLLSDDPSASSAQTRSRNIGADFYRAIWGRGLKCRPLPQTPSPV
jgi:hypothetical protein